MKEPKPSTPMNPPPATDSGRGELPAYLSNGVIGLRVRDIPLRAGVAVVAGLSGEHPIAQVEAAALAPYPLAGDIQIGRVWLSDALQCARFIRQDYDFSSGELHTELSFTVDGLETRLEILTFCSRSRPTIVLQQVQVEVSAACDVTLRASIDTAGIHGAMLRREIGTPGEPSPAVDGAMQWETLGGLSTCGVAYVTELVGAQDAERSRAEWGEQSALATDYHFRARSGHKVRLRQIASLVPSQLHHRPHEEARRLAAFARTLGFDTLRAENKAAWDELWKGRILLHGADARWQALADAAFYYLNASVHPSSPSSTSIFGLAQWYDYHYYYGHIMWDVETFSIPPLLFLQPDAARAMLDYRFRVRAGCPRQCQAKRPARDPVPLGERDGPG